MTRYVLALIAAVLVAAGIEAYATSRAARAVGAELAETRAHVDKTTDAVRELIHTVNPKADHMICPAHDGHPEIDLGVPTPCKEETDGMCVRDMPLSVADARCKAGKL